jgi:hypothetical protein
MRPETEKHYEPTNQQQRGEEQTKKVGGTHSNPHSSPAQETSRKIPRQTPWNCRGRTRPSHCFRYVHPYVFSVVPVNPQTLRGYKFEESHRFTPPPQRTRKETKVSHSPRDATRKGQASVPLSGCISAARDDIITPVHSSRSRLRLVSQCLSPQFLSHSCFTMLTAFERCVCPNFYAFY